MAGHTRAAKNIRKVWEVCYTVFMHISLRIPDELVAELDAEALRERRSRNQVIVMRLERVRTLETPIQMTKRLLPLGSSIDCDDPQHLTFAEVVEEVDRHKKSSKQEQNALTGGGFQMSPLEMVLQ